MKFLKGGNIKGENADILWWVLAENPVKYHEKQQPVRWGENQKYDYR